MSGAVEEPRILEETVPDLFLGGTEGGWGRGRQENQ